MGRRKAGAGGGHAAVLSAGAGRGVRPGTAAEATGRPPGKSLGASCSRPIHWRLSRLDGAESDTAQAEDAAGWDCPCTRGCQLTVDWRRTWRWLDARQAGSSHALVALKSLGSGERRCGQLGRGRLGAAMERTQPKLGGLERGTANTQDTARLGGPYTGGAQINQDWRAALRSIGARQAGSSHGEDAAKARWTGARRGKHTRHGALGCSIHWRRSNQPGLESGGAWTGGVARWEQPCTADDQSCVVRGRGLKTWNASQST
jgi:hypothetical protein